MPQTEIFQSGAVIASGTSTSLAITFPVAFNKYNIQVPTMTTALSLTMQHSMDGGTTFYNVYHPPINSSTVGVNQFVISMTAGVGGGVIPVPRDIGSFKMVRFLAATTLTNGLTITVFGSD